MTDDKKGGKDSRPTRKAKSKKEVQEAALRALEVQIEAPRVTGAYRIGILLVTLAMLILPVLYLALIVLVGWGVCYHLVEHADMDVRGKARVIAYLGPPFIGLVLIFFMIKPFFARVRQSDTHVTLSRKDQPFLYAFVERLCRALGAPAPSVIEADCMVNASAAYRKGLLNVFSSDLVLRIGLPLAADMNLRQIAGILAHEFGHFSQRTGMGVSYLIRSVNSWFARVVYQRDIWDERLLKMSNSRTTYGKIVGNATRGCVWLSRRILWLYMTAGHAISCFMSRQMEYDADHYEIRLVGASGFESAMVRIHLLSASLNTAHSTLERSFQEGRLAGNYPEFVRKVRDGMPAEVTQKIRDHIKEEPQGLFQTHPSSKNRILAARKSTSPGVFPLKAPGRVLFKNFDALCEEATFKFYRQVLGPSVKREHMRSVKEVVERQKSSEEDLAALWRYLQGTATLVRPLPLPAGGSDHAGEAEETVEALKKLRQWIRENHEAYRKALTPYGDALGEIEAAECARAALHAGIKISADMYGLEAPDASAVNQKIQAARSGQELRQKTLKVFEGAVKKRLALVSDLLQAPARLTELKEAWSLQKEFQNLLDTGRMLISLMPGMEDLYFRTQSLAHLAGLAKDNEQKKGFQKAFRAQERLVKSALRDLHQRVAGHAYPFEHIEKNTTLDRYLLPDFEAFHHVNPIEIIQTALGVRQRFQDTCVKVLTRVARIAEAVESAAGLDPLPEPAENRETQDADAPPRTSTTMEKRSS